MNKHIEFINEKLKRKTNFDETHIVFLGEDALSYKGIGGRVFIGYELYKEDITPDKVVLYFRKNK